MWEEEHCFEDLDAGVGVDVDAFFVGGPVGGGSGSVQASLIFFPLRNEEGHVSFFLGVKRVRRDA